MPGGGSHTVPRAFLNVGDCAMSKKRKKPGRKDELRNEIKQLGDAIEILHHMRLDATEKLHRLEAKPKRKQKRPTKCQSSGERVTVPAFLMQLH